MNQERKDELDQETMVGERDCDCGNCSYCKRFGEIQSIEINKVM